MDAMTLTLDPWLIGHKNSTNYHISNILKIEIKRISVLSSIKYEDKETENLERVLSHPLFIASLLSGIWASQGGNYRYILKSFLLSLDPAPI